MTGGKGAKVAFDPIGGPIVASLAAVDGARRLADFVRQPQRASAKYDLPLRAIHHEGI